MVTVTFAVPDTDKSTVLKSFEIVPVWLTSNWMVRVYLFFDIAFGL